MRADMSSIVLPWVSKELSPNARVHWAKKAKASKKCRETAFYATKKSGIMVNFEGTIHVWIDFYPPDKRNRDDDNVTAAFKPYRDGIADALSVDDKRFRMHPFLRHGEVRKGGVIIVSITPEPINFAKLTKE
jgi:crossover junction endodeoxyribonuclease RusA